MEIESAARWEALQDPTIAGYVSTRVFRHRLMEKVDGLGLSALVVLRDGGWASPDPVQSAEFPMLVFECHADPTRDAERMILQDDAADKAWALYRAVNRRFHGVRDEWWGARGQNRGLRVVTVARATEPLLEDDMTRHSYQRTLGDSVLVRAQYAVQTYH